MKELHTLVHWAGLTKQYPVSDVKCHNGPACIGVAIFCYDHFISAMSTGYSHLQMPT